MEWISSHKVQDLKHLLGDHTMMEKGVAILKERKEFMLHQGTLYHCHTLTRELKEALQFVVPMIHWVAAMNRCHRDMGHQCQLQTLSLLQDQFWWPGMVMWMQKVIISCERCIQHEGAQVKAPLQAILVTSPLELLHVDFTSIEMTMELDQPPHIVNFGLLWQLHKTHYGIWLADQSAKSVAKFLWQGYISIFRAPVKLLSDWGANFVSNIIRELCEFISIQKVRTLMYHLQTNGQVKHHQMLIWMTGKLGKDQKADWPKDLPELVHAYNSMRSVITRYILHYLMFGQWPCLPIHFYFPTIVSTEKHQHVNHYVTDLHEWLCEAFKEAQVQPLSEVERQRWYYDCKANAISLEPGNLVLAKADAYKGKRKVKDQWEEELYEVECRIAEGIPSYLMKSQQTKCSWVLHWNWLLLITPVMGAPSCTGVWAEQTRFATTILEEPTWKALENEKAP